MYIPQSDQGQVIVKDDESVTHSRYLVTICKCVGNVLDCPTHYESLNQGAIIDLFETNTNRRVPTRSLAQNQLQSTLSDWQAALGLEAVSQPLAHSS
jgi:hypothetical protein